MKARMANCPTMIALACVFALAACDPGDRAAVDVAEAPTTAAPPAPTATSVAPPTAVDNGDAAVDRSIDTVLGDHAAYRDLFGQLQAAIRRGDKPAVAALVQYPLQASPGGKKTTIRDAAAFVAQYDAIVTDDIRQAIAEQRYADLMVNAQGVMIGNGEVWLNGICADDACKQSTPRVVALQAVPAMR